MSQFPVGDISSLCSTPKCGLVFFLLSLRASDSSFLSFLAHSGEHFSEVVALGRASAVLSPPPRTKLRGGRLAVTARANAFLPDQNALESVEN